MRAKRNEAQSWLNIFAAYRGNRCMLWQFAQTPKGYGTVRFAGQAMNAHRAVCLMVHGFAPEGTEVAHSCGNKLCCTPAHLRHATSTENKADMVVHGTRLRGEGHPRAKLTAAAVRKIRRSDASSSSLAAQFGVTPKTVSLVREGVTWATV